MAEQQKSVQPLLHLLDAGDKVTLEDIIALFRSLTGRIQHHTSGL